MVGQNPATSVTPKTLKKTTLVTVPSAPKVLERPSGSSRPGVPFNGKKRPMFFGKEDEQLQEIYLWNQKTYWKSLKAFLTEERSITYIERIEICHFFEVFAR